MELMQRRRELMSFEHGHWATATGSIATFSTPFAKPLRSLKAEFTPVQEGTDDPSPTNVRPITGWTGCEVYRTKQNMIDLSVPYQNPSDTALVNTTIRVFKPYTYSYGASYSNWWNPHQIVSCSIEGNKLRVTTNSAAYGVGFAIPVKAGWVMRLSYNSTGRTHIAYYDRWGKYITGGPTNTINLTVPNQAAIGLIIFESYPSGTEVVFSDIMLTVQTASAYEPYQGQTISLDWTDEAGTVYGGYVDLVTGEVWETWGGVTLDGSQNAYISGSGYRGTNCTDVWFDAGSDKWGYNTSYAEMLADSYCDSLALTPKAIWGNPDLYPWAYVLNSVNQIHCVFDNSTVGITSNDTNAQAITKVKSWLASHPITVKYQLSDSKATLVTTLTPTELRTLTGTNDIWSTANGNVTAEYFTR